MYRTLEQINYLAITLLNANVGTDFPVKKLWTFESVLFLVLKCSFLSNNCFLHSLFNHDSFFILFLQKTGTLTVEEVYKDRDQFAALVREVAAPDVGRMGIEILSFTIKDVYDDVQYLQSLGKAQTASVKRDADTGVAEANR